MSVLSKVWPRPSASVTSVLIMGGLLLAAMIAMTGYEIWRQYANTAALAQRNLNILADVMAGEVNRSLNAVDAVLERSIPDLTTIRSTPPDDVRRILRERSAGIPQIHGLMIMDDQGAPIASLHGASQRQHGFAQTLRNAVTGQTLPVYIDIVRPAPFDGTPIIPMCRLRHDALGNVTGIVVAAMSVPYFQELFLQIKAIPGVSLTLARTDGAILAQVPESAEPTMNQRSEFQPQARDNGLIQEDTAQGTRIVAYRTLRPYGVRLSVDIPHSTLLATWRSTAIRLILVALGGLGAISLTIGFILRRLIREEQQQDRLRDAEQSHRMAQFSLDTSSDMVVWADNQGQIRYVNQAACTALGYDRDTLLTMSVPDIDPTTATPDWSIRLDALRNAGNLRFESVLYCRGDRRLPVEVSVNLMHMDGRDYTCAIIRDLVEHKRAEAILTERTRRLEASNAELEQFAYVASHDLREPLRMVTSFVGLLSKRCESHLDAEAREYVEFARQGALRMDRLILDLLEYARVGSTDRPMEIIDLEPVIRQTQTTLSLALQDQGGEILLPAKFPMIWGDADELGRLLTNLVGNALKYRHPDRAPRIEIGWMRQDGQVVMTVRDNGIGIAPQYFDRIFRIFQRLHGREHYDGTGIGLAVCKKIVERHGGRIWVLSTPGQGSTFFFTLLPEAPDHA